MIVLAVPPAMRQRRQNLCWIILQRGNDVAPKEWNLTRWPGVSSPVTGWEG